MLRTIFRNRYFFAAMSLLVVLYMASLLVQWMLPFEEQPRLYEQEQVVQGNGSEGSVSYLIIPSESDRTIVYLPDLTERPAAVVEYGEQLSQMGRVLIPLYGQFGDEDLRDGFSLSHRSELLAGLVNELSLEELHLVSKGYGALLATRFASDHQHTSAIASIQFIDPWGTVHYHLMGNVSINRIFYSLLHPLNWIQHHLIPHFGWARHSMLNSATIRSFTQLDQSFLQPSLSTLEMPVQLLIAGESGPDQDLGEAAIYRQYVPQSEVLWMNNINEGFPVSLLQNFLERTDQQDTLVRADAKPERIEASLESYDPTATRQLSGRALYITMLLIMVVTFFLEDPSTIAGGLLAASGLFAFHHAIIASFTAILLADVVVYWIGRLIGRPALRVPPFKWIVKAEDIEWAEKKFSQGGISIILVSRFIPGTRFPTFFTAGMVQPNFLKMLCYFVVAVSIWVPLIVGITVLVGNQMLAYLSAYQDYALATLMGIAVSVYLIIKVVIPSFSKKGRKRLAVRYRRIKKWISW
ncbi:MAG: DedA family protein [Balneolaceae bacterium]